MIKQNRSFKILRIALSGLLLIMIPARRGWAESQNQDKNLNIAVVGGGISGLTAAYTLQKKGYQKVTVFEKEPTIGGKINTFFYQNQPNELGAVIITDRYRTILKLAREFKIATAPARDVTYIYLNGEEASGGEYFNNKYSFLEKTQAMLAYQWTLLRYPGLAQPGFVNLNSELHQNIEVVSRQRGFFPITNAMAPVMTGCGYGYYADIPAIYWLKLMPFFTDLAQKNPLYPERDRMMSFPGGFQSLLTALARPLKVNLATEVRKIDRVRKSDKDKVILTTSKGTEIFDRVILSNSLQHADAYLDVSPEENDLFKKIITLRYMVTLAVTTNKVHAAVVDNVTPDTRNHVTFIGNFNGENGASTFYQLLDKKITLSEASEILESDLNHLRIEVQKVLTQKIWNYFPHVTQENLDAGFYEKLDRLQGVKGTYYTGALLSFETTEHAAEHAEYLVNRFFN